MHILSVCCFNFPVFPKISAECYAQFLRQSAGAMLNTTSQLLTVRRTGPKAIRVQNTDRILNCERAQLLCLTFCYTKRKPWSSLFAAVPIPKLHSLYLCSCCALDKTRNGPSEQTKLPRPSELRNATSGIRTRLPAAVFCAV